MPKMNEAAVVRVGSKHDKARYVGAYLSDPDLKAALEQEAAEDGITVSELIRRILENHISPDEPATVRQVQQRVQEIGKTVDSLIDEIADLDARKSRLDSLIESRSGFFSDPPEALKQARADVEVKIKKLCDQLAAFQGDATDDGEDSTEQSDSQPAQAPVAGKTSTDTESKWWW